MLNLLAIRGILVLATGMLFLTCNRNAERETAPNSAGAATLTSEKAQSAYDFVNSIGVNTHLNYFDVTYGNFQLVERELTSIGIRHVRDGVHLLNADYNQ